MLKHLIFGALSLFLAVVPARADLHYTLHTEARQVTPAEPVNPMLAMAGDIIVRTMLPDGPADSIYWISDRGTRVELTKANAVMPAGSVVLHLGDGTTVIMNPTEKTYWKIPLPQIMPEVFTALSQLNPQLSFVHTGEFATIAGVRAEHITSSTTMDVPSPPPGAPVPMGMPAAITMSADLWMADRYVDNASLAQAAATMMGFGALIHKGSSCGT